MHIMKIAIAMKNIKTTTIILLFALQGWVNLHAQSTLSLVESAGNCGLATNCANNTICLDIILTPGVTAQVLSYNIWVNYPNADLNYVSVPPGSPPNDSACITANGNDNNLNALGYYRVAGVTGSMTVTAGVPVNLHTICFTYNTIPEIDGDPVTVGGTLFGAANSTITYNNPPSNEPTLPEFLGFVLNSSTISCILLPVHWLSFDAHKQGETSVLDWSTSEELNNKGFEVLRSTNGQYFEKIGWVDATTELAPVNKYQFIDAHPLRGINYYRLKQVDLDGKTDFSPVRNLSFNSRNFAVSVTPNPADEFFYVEIQTEAEFSEITLMDVTGRIVLSKKTDNTEPTTLLDVSKLSPGAYTLMVQSGIDQDVQQLIVMD